MTNISVGERGVHIVNTKHTTLATTPINWHPCGSLLVSPSARNN